MDPEGSASEPIPTKIWTATRAACWFAWGLVGVLWAGAMIATLILFRSASPSASVAGPLAFVAAVVTFIALVLPRSVEAGTSGIMVRAWCGWTRRIERSNIVGIEPRSPWADHVLIRTFDGRRGFHLRDMGLQATDVHGELVSMFGQCPVHPDLVRGSEYLRSLAARCDAGETFTWRHRKAHVVGIWGLFAIFLTLAFAVSTPWWLQWLINLPHGSAPTVLPVAYAAMFVGAFAILTLMDLARGGPIVALHADPSGIEFRRWWRVDRLEARDIVLVPYRAGDLLCASLAPSGPWSPTRRVVRERDWICQPAELVGTLIVLFGTPEPPAPQLPADTIAELQ